MASYSDTINNFGPNIEDLCSLNSELSLKILKPLDEVLRCRICDEYFKNCMITKCSHNYCSICIRRYMMHKSQCPTCFQDAFEPDLRNNRLIDEVLRAYIKIRDAVEDAMVQQDCKTDLESVAPFTPVKIEVEKDTLPWEDSQETKPICEKEDDADSKDVACPVCYKLVLRDKINIHLDICLKQQEKERMSERKTLPKLVYHLLSDKEIKKKLKEHGLSATGSRQVLIKRHKNFIVLFNANCDSLDPKSVEELVQEIALLELEEQLNSFPKQIQVHKKSDISEIECEHESYVKRHQSQFNALINEVQQRHLAQVTVKQEIKECPRGLEDSQQNSILDQFGNVIGEGTFSAEKAAETSKLLFSNIKKEPCEDDRGQQKLVKEPDESDSKIYLTKSIKQEFSSPISKTKSKNQDKSQRTLTDGESPPSSPDFEIGKITQKNALRKRKKRTVTVENQFSPKKK